MYGYTYIYRNGKAVNLYKFDIGKGTHSPESVRNVSGDDMVDKELDVFLKQERKREKKSVCVIFVGRIYIQVVIFLFCGVKAMET